MGLDIEPLVARLRTLRRDDANIEAKSAVGKLPKSVWEAVSAFANTDGGLILLGLDENDAFRPARGFDPRPILDALSNGLNVDVGRKVAPLPPTEVAQIEFEGGVVIALTVRPLTATPAPCYVTDRGLESGSFRRWDDQNISLTSYEIYLLRHRHEQLGTDREPVLAASLEDLDADVIARMMARLRAQGSRALTGTTDVVGGLRRLSVVDSQGTPTLAGLLSLAVYPQQFFPQLFIDVAVHPGNVKGLQADSRRFLDRQICEGPIPVAVEQAVQAVARNLRTAHIVEGVRGADVLEIPEEVLREAIVNAVTHRDYSRQVLGQQVAVDVYPDRVEVVSPGGFWGGITRDNVDQGRSCSRNDTLAKLLTRVPLPLGEAMVCENQGSGVARMIGVMRTRGLPAPVFESAPGHVKVVLRRFGLMNPATRAWLESITPRAGLRPQEEIALVLAHALGSVTVQDVRHQAGVDSDDAREDLDRLVQLGLFVRLGLNTYSLLPETELLTPAQQGLLLALSLEAPRNIRAISALTGRSPNALRPVLRELIAQGRVVATAPATSRSRAYLLASTPGSFVQGGLFDA